MRTADIILEQLGGNRFVVMTGSSHFISDGNTLRMHLAKNGSKANRLEITLNGKIFTICGFTDTQRRDTAPGAASLEHTRKRSQK